jgi:NAD(P)-dependent dehydrogenase (short-subunit alcohol dehydrogenase family)
MYVCCATIVIETDKSSVPGVHFYRCDVTDTAAVEDVCKEIRQAHGEVTVLINNAGIGIGKTVLDVSHAITRPSQMLMICPDKQCGK